MKLILSVIFVGLMPQLAGGFTQYAQNPAPMPMGHEWLTRMGASVAGLKLQALQKASAQGPVDSKLAALLKMTAQSEVDRIRKEPASQDRIYASTYLAVYSAILG